MQKNAESPGVKFSAPDSTARSSADQAAKYIRRLIFDGELRSGSRIPQDEIAAALHRSRVPVREALIALEGEGWVTTIVNRGAYVATFTPGSIRDHYEMLGFVYGLAARRAVENDVADLDDKLAALALVLRDVADLDTFDRAAQAFHAAITEAAASPRIRSVLRSMSAFVSGNFFRQVPGSAAVEKKSTTAIRKAIANRDADKAAAEYGSMLRQHADQVVNLLASRGFFPHQPPEL